MPERDRHGTEQLPRLTNRSVAKGRGGAIANTDSTILTAANCAFERNEAGQSGGAVSSFQRGRATLTGCRYEGNKAGSGPADEDLEAAGPRDAPPR